MSPGTVASGSNPVPEAIVRSLSSRMEAFRVAAVHPPGSKP